MNHNFSTVPSLKIPRSLFKRDHNLKTTINTDYIYPIYCDEALPGDTFQFRQHLFARLNTPITPIMDNLYLDTFFFAVPLRLVDDNFKKFMGERPFGDTSTEYLVPQLESANAISVGSLSDYLGLPIGVPNLKFSAYWHRAYNLIYNEFFRDENLCEPRPVAGKHYDGTVTTEALSDYVLCKRGKRHDYFTSCLPFAQKGDPVTIGLGNTAPVFGDGNVLRFSNGTTASYGLGTSATPGDVHTFNAGSTDMPISSTTVPASTGLGRFGVSPKSLLPSGVTSGLIADLSNASSVTINALREAFAIQSLLETDARGGTRYIEIIRAHFGVVSPDARMQRPEYLGGNSEMIQITTVPQSSSTNSVTPQGNLAAFGTFRNNAYWSHSFTEHCVIIGLANVRADLSYQQGIPRMFSRRTRYDFYWPELANLGEQAVLNKEIYAQGSNVLNANGTPVDDDAFGYQERWAEYRYHPNLITGLFRSNTNLTLDYWHLAQNFENLPTLNSTFIEEAVPIDRVVALPDEPTVIMDGFFEVKCARPMPLFSIPGIGRRF